jgi:hypothetical protein
MRTRFGVGDAVVFVPDRRTIGWHQHSFERWGIYPGYRGVVTSVEGPALVVDNKDGFAIDASQFRTTSEVSLEEAERLRANWEAQLPR